MSTVNIHFQKEFSPEIQKIKNHREFNKYRLLLERMDEIIRISGIDLEFAGRFVEFIEEKYSVRLSAKSRAKKIEYAVKGLRCNILHGYTRLSFEKLSCRIAESPLLQWFIGASRIDGEISVPCRSQLHKYSQMLTPEEIEMFVQKALDCLVSSGEALGLEKNIDCGEIYVDACALEAKIHFPVDWVLLRDAVRTLIKSILTIRRHGLIHRMSTPEDFLSAINRECMSMSSARKNKDANKKRKLIFRRMKKIELTVREHGRRYFQLLKEKWMETDLGEDEAEVILHRMENVLEKIPEAVRQAHKRIIRGEQTENARKILSLYDEHVNVIVRGKDRCEVEFGNSLFLAEQKCGFVVDWKLYQDSAPGDTRKLEECLDRLAGRKIDVTGIAGDRGFDSASTSKRLARPGNEIYNAICPKDKTELARRQEDPRFRKMQKRRAQTEARISIVRNGFIGNPGAGRSFGQRRMDTAWAIFTHNVWVVARMPEKEEQELLKTG